MIYPFEAPRKQQSKLLSAKNKNKKRGTVTYNNPTPSLHRTPDPKPPNPLPPPL